MIKTVNSIKEVVRGSFGWFNKSQVLVCPQNNTLDYTELTNYFLKLNKTRLDDQSSVSFDQVLAATTDLTLSAQSQEAAKKLYEDVCEVMAYTNKVALYVQNVEYQNAASKWHFDKNGRTIFVKYNGAATQMAHPNDVLSYQDSVDSCDSLVLCDVDPNATPIEIENGSVFSITGTDNFLVKPTAHRKPPLNGEPSLILIAEP